MHQAYLKGVLAAALITVMPFSGFANAATGGAAVPAIAMSNSATPGVIAAADLAHAKVVRRTNTKIIVWLNKGDYAHTVPLVSEAQSGHSGKARDALAWYYPPATLVLQHLEAHTSVIRFIEQRFGVREPNTTPWRRAIYGDLTSAFDFCKPDERLVSLPSTANYVATVYHESTLPPPEVPEEQPVAIIPQEKGMRRRRPLPYDTRLRLEATAQGVRLHIANPANIGVVCTTFWNGSAELPHHYTVGAGAELEDMIELPEHQKLALILYGPDGFIRTVSGQGDSYLHLGSEGEKSGDLALILHNTDHQTLAIHIHDLSYGVESRQFQLTPGETRRLSWPLANSHHWYELKVRTATHSWRLAGHVEDGKESCSDPANIKPELAI